MARPDIVICSPVRTAIGTYNGTLKDTPAVELGATAIKACLDRAKVDGKDVGTVVMGNVIQAGNKMNPARQAAIAGGIPVEVPAMTVDGVCGSGAQAIATAAAEIQSELIDTAIVGGMENMDAAPYLMYGGRWGYRMGNARSMTPCCRTASMMRSRRAFRLAHRGSCHQVPDHACDSGCTGGCGRSSGFLRHRRRASSMPRSHR